MPFVLSLSKHSGTQCIILIRVLRQAQDERCNDENRILRISICHSQLAIWSSGFLIVACSGIVASAAGFPTTSTIIGFSCDGRLQT